jgi:hypothetical protein
MQLGDMRHKEKILVISTGEKRKVRFLVGVLSGLTS